MDLLLKGDGCILLMLLALYMYTNYKGILNDKVKIIFIIV